MTKPKLLVVDDDESIRTQVKYALRDDYTLWFAEDRAQAMALFHEVQPGIVSLDLGLPPDAEGAEEGLKTLDEILRASATTKVVVVTGNSDRENALRAVQLGAFDYHLKPIDLPEYKVVLRRAAYLAELAREGEAAAQVKESSVRFEEIIGSTPRMREIFAVIQRVAKTDATVLIEGESGTGKELIARAVHSRSVRKNGPFVAINCGAIPETLLESELFGHERGAFTGAHVQRQGKFELASRGTLFLDEIGELPVLLQVKILRFLQERTIERLGGRQPISVDLRVIAATNRDLKSHLQQGLFREDLYYRLSVVTHRPAAPARAGRGHPAHRQPLSRAGRTGAPAPGALRPRRHPGHDGACLAGQRPRDGEPREPRGDHEPAGASSCPRTSTSLPPSRRRQGSLRDTRERVERQTLVEVLSRHRGNVSQAARELKVSRPTLHGLLDKHAINAKDFR